MQKNKSSLESICKNITHLEAEFQTMEEVKQLAELFSAFHDHPDKVYFGIFELLLNAVEHGNLGISFDEKTELLESGSWESEIHKRLRDPKFHDKKAKAVLNKNNQEIVIKILDEGKGFNWQKYLDEKAVEESSNLKHGRGIIMSKIMCFDKLTYEDPGNVVIATSIRS